MKITVFRTGLLSILAVLLGACAGQATPAPSTLIPEMTNIAPTVQGAVQDLDSFVAALKSAGVTVEPGEAVDQTFFSVQGQTIKVNGADIQVFVYDTAQAMEAEAATVAADGGSIGTSMVNWVDVPHFFKAGRVLVLYVGQDQAVLDVLKNILGPQFAGH